MKKSIATILILFISILSCVSQEYPAPRGVKTPHIIWQPYTTAQKTTLSFTASERVILYDSDLSAWQQWDGDSWEAFGSGGSSDNIYTTSGITPASSNRYLDIGSNGSFAIRTADFKNYLSITSNAVSLYNGYGNLRLRTGSGGTYDATTVGQVWTATDNVGGGKFQDALGGDVTKVGTPIDNQIGVWTGDGTIEGASNLTYNGVDFFNTGKIYSGNLGNNHTVLNPTYIKLDNSTGGAGKLEIYIDKIRRFNNGNSAYTDLIFNEPTGVFTAAIPALTANDTIALKSQLDAISSFDPTINQTITGNWSFQKPLTLDSPTGQGLIFQAENNSQSYMVFKDALNLEKGRVGFTSSSDNHFRINTATNSNTYIQQDGTTMLSILNGVVGINTATPSIVYKLDVNGNVRANTYYGDGSNLTGISSGHTIQEEGVDQTARAKLNFKGDVIVDDNVGNNSTDITIAINGGLSPNNTQEKFTAVGGETTWVLSNTPSINTTNQLFIGGILQEYGVGYSLAGSTITFLGINSPLVASDKVEYHYNIIGTGTLNASDIADFDTKVSNNASVTANTAKVSYDSSREIGIALSAPTGAITTTGVKETIYMPYAMTLTDIRMSATVAPTTSVFTLNILEDGVTIFSTNITIDPTENGSWTAATPYVLSDTSLAQNSAITFDVTAVDSGGTCEGLKVWLIGTK